MQRHVLTWHKQEAPAISAPRGLEKPLLRAHW